MPLILFLFFIFSLEMFEKSHAQPGFEWKLNHSFFNKTLAVVQMEDGGFALSGELQSSLSSSKLRLSLIRIDGRGNLIWTKLFGGNNGEFAGKMIRTNDGGFAILGTTFSFGVPGYDAYLVKVDREGEFLWQKIFHPGEFQQGQALTLTLDGGFLLAGYAYDTTSNSLDMFATKTNSFGEEIWTTIVREAELDAAFSVSPFGKSGYLVGGGNKNPTTGKIESYLMQLSEDGKLLNEWRFPDSLGNCHIAAIKVDGARNIYLGEIGPRGLLRKLDHKGNLLWQREGNSARSLVLTSDGGVVLVGHQPNLDNSILIRKFSAKGNTLWDTTFATFDKNVAYDIIETKDGGLAFAGMAANGNDSFDTYFVKTDCEGNIEFTASACTPTLPPVPSYRFQVYPSLVSRYLTVETDSLSGSGDAVFSVFDMDGKFVQEWKGFPAGENSIDLDGLSPGLYFYQYLGKGGFFRTGKLIRMD